MRIEKLASAFIAAIALAACQPAPAANEAHDAVAEQGPALGEFTAAAKVLSMTDAGYPMYVLVVQLPDQPTPAEYLLNAAEVDLGDLPQSAYDGKNVTMTYAVVAENDLFDLREGDLSLVHDAPARAAHWKEVAGVLSGAEQATAGDLPSLIAVTDANGNKTEFEYFVTPQIAAANGKQVTAYYSPSTSQRVKALRLAVMPAK